MYEKLIKRLHQRIALTTAGTPLQDDLRQAADAIEKLAKDLERSRDFEAFWQHEAEETLKKLQVAISNKPRWIPVTERLPEKDGTVLAYYGFNRGDGYLGMMFAQVLDYYATDPKPHFQHESTGLTVTHWMPLLEPPKEE